MIMSSVCMGLTFEAVVLIVATLHYIQTSEPYEVLPFEAVFIIGFRYSSYE